VPTIYVNTVYAKPGHEDAVTENYRQMAQFLKTVDGYRGGHMLRERKGAMMEALVALRKSQGEEPPKAQAEHGESGTHFVIVQIWESDEARAKLSRTPGYAPIHQDLVPHLLEAHTHELYEDFSDPH
jgi:heme-degrading monooxygenase HmoA